MLIVAAALVVVVGGWLTYGVLISDGEKSEWYQEGYAIGHEKAALARITGKPDGVCDLALIEKIRYDESERSFRVKQLRASCRDGLRDALNEKP